MSFDPFEARLQFLQLLKKLNASQLSIQKVVSFAIKYGSRCGEDMWECVVEQCGKGSLNTRINILYFLDTLLEASLPLGPTDAPYPGFVTSNLKELVEKVVPDSREGVLNLRSAKQILESWRMRRVIDHDVIEEVLKSLEGRTYGHEVPSEKRSHEQAFSKTEILRRMEEDRERHKRLRERIWILPIPPLHPPRSSAAAVSASAAALASASASKSSPSTASPFTPASPRRSATSRAPSAAAGAGERMPPPPIPAAGSGSGEGSGSNSNHVEHSSNGSISGLGGVGSALQVEFEQAWELTSDLDEEELNKMRA
ncbi:CTD kinase subunit gamma [Kwoniella heveanensis BCC8398]|uniref:CTD kinase subunit gamma n=1 Tax=Kwoniella heveanensis BCC8398 TaxID=1296120 RepID=A0A1B9GLK3_9TREE|nr:CTD kinase subunit gamma [Kwoniella heveanensis BCC8398]